VFDGDSLTTGFGLTIPPAKTYPTQVIELGGGRMALNRAVGAQTLAQMEADASTDIDGLLSYAGGTLTVQFAQNASNGSASSVLVGSWFRVWDAL